MTDMIHEKQVTVYRIQFQVISEMTSLKRFKLESYDKNSRIVPLRIQVI